ncbi:MAG: heme exporter protein CcmD [Nitrosospira sp.]|jgi:heme exporter protein D|nr:heme exporter protein CcmD [Nitrosospira sp.]MDW7642780.1 heme exporter protein CcmD [Nitrosomonadaceae bacterium]MBI0407078.1 heme exporter protein CcmD [Nitrosospira sp.]MBI0415034.1 heme exporter protein CcmD [Nitrosospira sp.]MBI0415861.1 heme exporter protein CcmD [Nitrosospira sp.]
MNWTSWSDFISMGGYGYYVWGSYLISFICIAGEIILVSNRKRTLLKQISLTKAPIKQERK